MTYGFRGVLCDFRLQFSAFFRPIGFMLHTSVSEEYASTIFTVKLSSPE
jgi:hypothetical protein